MLLEELENQESRVEIPRLSGFSKNGWNGSVFPLVIIALAKGIKFSDLARSLWRQHQPLGELIAITDNPSLRGAFAIQRASIVRTGKSFRRVKPHLTARQVQVKDVRGAGILFVPPPTPFDTCRIDQEQ